MNASPSPHPPGRALLRLAGVFTQVACAACLLLGTIAFVLVQQNKSDGAEYVIPWAIGAMTGLIAGGLLVRGGLFSLLLAATLDLAFGTVLLVLDHETLASLLRVLPEDDIAMIGDALVGAAIGMLVVGALCLLAIPQALRYGRWLHASSASMEIAPGLGSTERGWAPPPSPRTSSVWRAPAAPVEERRSRRRMYIALAGFAIGVGAGIGVLVSSSTGSSAGPASGGAVADGSAGSGKTGSAVGEQGRTKMDPGVVSVDSGSGSGSGSAKAPDEGTGSLFVKKPKKTVEAMLQDQRAAIGNGDLKALVATLAPGAACFGVDHDEVAIGRPAVEAMLKRDLGDLAGVTVVTRFSQVGGERDHAWIAQELELQAGRTKRAFTVTQLAAAIDGTWQVVACHWARPVRDSVAERVALLGTKPSPSPITSKLDGPKELEAAVRAAFGSRKGFIETRSERADGFNFGSGPSERIVGGAQVKKIFGRLSSEIRVHDGVLAVAGNAWDPLQRGAPWIAYALVNADYTSKTRAATELTHTFRVLAVLLREGNDWKVVQTQWSHGGPIR